MRNWYIKVRFCYKLCNEKMDLYQQCDVDVKPPAYNFIKTLGMRFSYEVRQFFQPSSFLKRDPSPGVFL